MVSLTKENNLNLLRLMLALLVFVAHFNTLTGLGSDLVVFHLSGYAVQLFFIVSGFLIWWSFDLDSGIKNYLIKRIFRIYPLYLLVVIFQVIFFYFNSGFEVGEELFKYFIVNAVFLNFLQPSVGDTLSHLKIDAINGALWTLKIEVMFYFSVPVIFYLYRKLGYIFLYIIFFSSLFWANYFDGVLARQLPGQLMFFVVGIFIYLFLKKEIQWNTLIYPFAGLVLLCFFTDEVLFLPVILGVIFLLLGFYFKLPKVFFDFSYSIYILHFPIIQIALFYGLIDSGFFSFMCVLLILLVIAFFVEKYIELPSVRFGRGLIK